MASLKEMQLAQQQSGRNDSSKSSGSDRELRRWRDKVAHLIKCLDKAKVYFLLSVSLSLCLSRCSNMDRSKQLMQRSVHHS